VRESSTVAARLEPCSGAVNVEVKQNGTDRRSPVELHGTPQTNDKSIRQSDNRDDTAAAQVLAANAR
jgi:hypothetical protein